VCICVVFGVVLVLLLVFECLIFFGLFGLFWVLGFWGDQARRRPLKNAKVLVMRYTSCVFWFAVQTFQFNL